MDIVLHEIVRNKDGGGMNRTIAHNGKTGPRQKRGYTRAEMDEQIRRAMSDASSFYNQPFVNYRGKTTDTKERYTEIVAHWLMDNPTFMDSIAQITRETTYKTFTHTGNQHKGKTTNREEEYLAKALHDQGNIPGLGEVLDYQTPLKDRQSDNAGKIDLLAYDGKTLRLLELKRSKSNETMLRCILECHTYLKTVNSKKLLHDFGLPAGTAVKACALVSADSRQHGELDEDRPWLRRLMAALDIGVFCLKEENDPNTGNRPYWTAVPAKA